jgi:general secretion pathway protein N
MASASQRLPTYVLGAIAVWSLLVAIVVYTGLGGRYALHPDDASRVPELPRLDLSRAQNPLQPLDQYAVVGERPLFNADRRPIPLPDAPPATDEAAPPPPLDVVLTGVILSGETRIGIFLDKKANKSQSVRVGGALTGEQAGWTLVELAPRKAVFEGPTGRSEAELRVFDGQGGEAPTPIASAAPEAVRADGEAGAAGASGVAAADPNAAAAQPQTPESRAELIRRRIEERRRQMREEAERANKQNNGQ